MDVLHAGTSRLDKEFRFLQQWLSFKTFDVQAFHAPKADQLNCSSEASVRICANTFLPLSTDSERITQPEDENSGCFPSLKKFIEDVLQDFTVDLKLTCRLVQKVPMCPSAKPSRKLRVSCMRRMLWYFKGSLGPVNPVWQNTWRISSKSRASMTLFSDKAATLYNVVTEQTLCKSS